MQVPSPSAPASAPAPAPEATEIVHRPTSPLQRGKFEAPPWAFYVMGGAVVVAACLYAVIALLVRASRKQRARGPESRPASRRAR